MLRRFLIGVAIVSGILFVIPLIYVQLTVPEVYRKPADNSVQGRTHRVSELAIIHNYRKEGRRVAVVQRPIIFIKEGTEGEPDEFTVISRGYKTDFASLPALARLFFNPFDSYAEAAVLHDWLYAIGEPGKKREADMIFLRAMLDDGVSPIVARYFYTAVRFGTLVDGGGYAREREWSEAFYATPLEVDLPAACIRDRPATAFSDLGAIYTPERLEDLPVEMKRGDYNAYIAVLLQGFDPAMPEWLEKLDSPECRSTLGALLLERVDTDYGHLYDIFGEERRDSTKEVLTDATAVGVHGDVYARGAFARSYFDAFLLERHGVVSPDELWCQDLRTRAHTIAIVLYSTDEELNWPEMACPIVEGAAQEPTAD